MRHLYKPLKPLTAALAALPIAVGLGFTSASAASSHGSNVSADYQATQSGRWLDPATWGGQVPRADADVRIPAGVTVQIQSDQIPRMGFVIVDGTLRFASAVNTALQLDTLITSKSGNLQIGTASQPISSQVTAEIVFADTGAISKRRDPSLINRGAVLHGTTAIFGAEKTAFLPVATFPRRGDTSLSLKSAPRGWRVGDQIVIAGTDPRDPTRDDKVTITAVQGRTVSFAPALRYDHTAPRADLDVHVANLTRNVVFRSESAKSDRRGHLMFMHTNKADVNFAAFVDMGRSDKVKGYNDHEFIDLDPNIPAKVLGGSNVRGRYPVHFHKAGTWQAARVHGSVVQGSIGWGFVNHSSNVDFTSNVTYDVVGGAYFTEGGDELGSFVNNIALRTVHPNDPLQSIEEVDPDTREHLQDYGFQGDGFWFHGPNVRVEGNVVAGASGHGYIWWPEGLLERTPNGQTAKVFHDTAHVKNGHLIGRDGTQMQIFDVPMRSFKANETYSATKGIQVFYLHSEFFGEDIHHEDGTIDPPRAYDRQLRSVLDGSIVWNVQETAFAAPYANRLTLKNSRFFGSSEPASIGIDVSHFLNQIGLEVSNNRVEGFETGIRVNTLAEVSMSGNRTAGNGQNVVRLAVRDEDEDGDLEEQDFDDEEFHDEDHEDFADFEEEKFAEIDWLLEVREETDDRQLKRKLDKMIPLLERMENEDDFWDAFEPLAEEIEDDEDHDD